MPKHHGEAYWEEKVAEFERSGLGVRAFARSRGLKLSTFGNWRNKIREKKNDALINAEFIEIVSTSPEHTRAPISTPARLHVGGAVLEFSDLPSVNYVAALLREVTTC